ncbi:MAG TPA: PAS domain-containing sensor histidine kinase, partial [Smithellaceae bacterium]|nr:PAS domain-containing sensor histidine kinase [Smithellaceae bacterium]
ITIIATIPDPYFEANLERHFTYVNHAFLSLVGYNLDELSQMHYEDFLEEKASEQVLNLFNTVHTTGMTMKNVEIEIKNHSGEKRIVNLSLSLIRNPLDEPTGFHGIMRDVTAKKEAEAMILESSAKLIEYSESLELSVSERTAELEKAKVAAEAASRAKSDFLANISHEFQTPLNSIVGFTKVLKDRLFGDLNPKQEEFVRYISEAGETLSKLLNEIIDVSSVSTGRTLLNLTTVSLPKALTQAVSLLNRQIQEKSHTVTVDVALEADVRLEGDEEKIRQIFFQLLSNAVKYTPAGGKIIVDAQRAGGKAGEDGVKVAIKDNGPGIRPEDIPRLFQNFGRLESAYTRESSGVGVGLALTRQLVELHGGDIQVESEYGRGSAFSVFLPLKQKRPDIPE